MGRKRTRRHHATPTSITYLTIDPRLPQLFQQRLCLDEITRVEAFREPGVDGRQQRASLGTPALAFLESREAHRGTQLEGLRLLRARDVERAAEERLGLRGARGMGGEEQLALQAVQLRIPAVRTRMLGKGERILQHRERFGVLTCSVLNRR